MTIRKEYTYMNSNNKKLKRFEINNVKKIFLTYKKTKVF